ncbi:MAG TPA: 16S rRNA (guanine(527)-N(7))-methyltransferase RsmG [Dehalococcoidia bacterium]|jgi:16S rRNA (guanine527-N7)-methyltransferase|nr:16S rRNA (guanine(527)-N(7))-methyltransferase RsmG [Dehalococcoidia bacterium]
MGCQRSDGGSSSADEPFAARARALGILPDELVLKRFDRYEALLIEHGSRFNLTAVRDPAGIRRRHFEESLALGVALTARGTLQGRERVIDVGSGAGLPGIPLAIAWPGLRLTLLEATGKKAAFLSLAVRELDLHRVQVVALRAEDAARLPELRERFDLAVARAVARLNALAELLLPFVRVGGAIAAVKGSRTEEEVADARRALRLCGGSEPQLVPLPGSSAPLRLVVATKLRPTPAAYPRRAGVPVHDPLR